MNERNKIKYEIYKIANSNLDKKEKIDKIKNILDEAWEGRYMFLYDNDIFSEEAHIQEYIDGEFSNDFLSGKHVGKPLLKFLSRYNKELIKFNNNLIISEENRLTIFICVDQNIVSYMLDNEEYKSKFIDLLEKIKVDYNAVIQVDFSISIIESFLSGDNDDKTKKSYAEKKFNFMVDLIYENHLYDEGINITKKEIKNNYEAKINELLKWVKYYIEILSPVLAQADEIKKENITAYEKSEKLFYAFLKTKIDFPLEFKIMNDYVTNKIGKRDLYKNKKSNAKSNFLFDFAHFKMFEIFERLLVKEGVHDFNVIFFSADKNLINLIEMPEYKIYIIEESSCDCKILNIYSGDTLYKYIIENNICGLS